MNKSNLVFFIGGSALTASLFVCLGEKDTIVDQATANLSDSSAAENVIEYAVPSDIQAVKEQTNDSDTEARESLTNSHSSDKNDSFYSAVENLDADSLDAPAVSANAIQKVFYEESRNPEWASVKEDSLSAILYSPDFSSHYPVSNVQCKSTSCKFEFSAESTSSMIEGISQFVGSSIVVEELSGLEIATNNDLENGISTVYLIDRSSRKK